ncbi:transposase [Leptolyngbya sp. Heron Island J]|uniref:IS5-like element ISLesp5 family transposase n=1 Tax=Leptolyngbya sp. Heron Island J TaxID=1385935 RepID=UPI0003B9E2B3|nr:IS5-like element ISLesp5 family transposase [Leptolyngbya sp. Heron Island J]ESA34119.1 transposase [Leptolyngbya sp. Heron Island J]
MKRSYKLRNWSEYTAALVKRGSLTLWLSEEVIETWENTQKTGNPGASKTYSDLAIQTLLTLRVIYGLALRQTIGFAGSIFELMGVSVALPVHTTLSRRQKTLIIDLPTKPATGGRHVVVDSTGIKVYGEGEWKTRQHGVSKRRTWLKLHLGVDEQTGEILAAVVTSNAISDGEILPALLDQIPDEIDQVSADGAYDRTYCYDAIDEREATAAIPPRKDAKIWFHGNRKQEPHPRDENLRAIRKQGRSNWKEEINYHRRSLSETAMYRVKTIFTGEVSARCFENQTTELMLECSIINKFSHLGMPDSYLVEG